VDDLTSALRTLTSGKRLGLADDCRSGTTQEQAGLTTPPVASPERPRLSKEQIDEVLEMDRRWASGRGLGESLPRILAQEIMDISDALGLTLDQRLWFGKAAVCESFTPQQAGYIRRFYVEHDVFNLYWKQQANSEAENQLGGYPTRYE